MKPENHSILIRHETCDTCRKCVQVCPAGILVQERKKEPIGVEHLENCIVCGPVSYTHLTGLVEPRPDEAMLDILGMKNELRRPMMLIVSAIKK